MPGIFVVVTALEVTQSVQDLQNSVPLVAGKRTIVRVYARAEGPPIPVVVTGQLSVTTGAGVGVAVASSGPAVLSTAVPGDMAAARDDPGRSLNFELPAMVNAAGQIRIRLTAVTEVGTASPLLIGGSVQTLATFVDGPPLRLRVLRVGYSQGVPAVRHAPSDRDYALLISWLRRAYPVPDVVASQAVIDATAAAPFTADDVNVQLAAIRALDMDAGADPRTHYYGLVSDGGFFMRGSAAGVPRTPDPRVVASGPTGPTGPNAAVNAEGDFDGSYGDWYGGHELGHTFGRKHPGFCGESADDLADFPFVLGQLANADAAFAGFDVGDAVNALAPVALPGTAWHDVMTYCTKTWPSSYTYDGIRRRLADEEAGFGPALDAGAAPVAAARIEPFPALNAPVNVNRTEPTAISVIAKANLTRGTGAIAYVHPVSNLQPTDLPPTSRAHLLLSATDGSLLADLPVPVSLHSEIGPADDQEGIVDIITVVAPEVSAIELLIDGRIVDTFRADTPPPATRAIIMAAGPEAFTLNAHLDRAPDPAHSFSIQVSTDSGHTWQTLAVGLPQPTLQIDRTQFPPGQQVLVRVVTTNGFTTSITSSDGFRT